MTSPDPSSSLFGPPPLDSLTLQGIAQALWMKEYDREQIPPDILARVEGEKNSERAYARRFLARIDELEANQRPFVPSRTGRYALLRQHLEAQQRATPRQLYAGSLFLGPESNVGYEPIPLDPAFELPGIDLPQLRHQLGWHFFVGNFTDADGGHYAVELMFWQYSLLPPKLAATLGLTETENQSLEMHLAIDDPQANIQYRAATVVAAGTTGLVEIAAKPFALRLGNSVEGEDPAGNLFPARLRARGWDMGKTPQVEFEIDLSLENSLGYFKQGDGGCSPSVDGLGTLYYSASLLGLRSGVESAITVGGRRIVLTGGRMWYDHQWTGGFMPAGAAKHAVMRAVANLSTPAPGGWDWFEFQFHPNAAISPLGEAQITLSALHSTANARFYAQSGPTPPGTMTAPLTGKLILPNGAQPIPADPWAKTSTKDLAGTMTVSAWVKNESSPDPAVYPVTHAWYPAAYRFRFDDATLPVPLREFTVTPLIASGQMGWFGNGLQYTEGGAVVHDLAGREIGRGFAEGTGWASTRDTVITLAGLPLNDATRALLDPVPVPFWLKVLSWIYTLVKSAELKKIISEARGLSGPAAPAHPSLRPPHPVSAKPGA
jgi:predicted secreted hydrolase